MNLNNCPDPWKLDFFKKFYYIWFIELDIFHYISFNILGKLKISFNEITPSRFIFAMNLAVLEYLEELIILVKAKIWFEHHTGIKPSSLSEDILIEYREWFIKFWTHQITAFSRPELINQGNYITNMYDLNNVYEELLENILFAQSKILEAQWSINTSNQLFLLYGGIEYLNTDDKIINFYNELFSRLKLEIIGKYKDIYDLRRAYQVERFHNHFPHNCEELSKAYEHVQSFNTHLNFNSKLSKLNWNKKLFQK
jgi:hypothetical protein